MTPAREESNRLLSQAYQAAERLLSRNRGFEPFAITMDQLGLTQVICPALDPTKPSTIEQRVAYGHDVLRQMAEDGEAKATALVVMMQLRLKDKEGQTDAVVLELEHREEGAVNFYVPYEWKEGKPVFGEIIARRQVPRIFPRKDQG